MNSSARRLPRVMVPVLSSTRVLMSPQASTARPEVAITLNWATRSIPAIPMALSSPPMVVGIRATNRATRVTTEGTWPRKAATGGRVTTAIRNTWVSTASSTVSAISLGVLLRSAPSTRAIMRSMKPLPGSALMRRVSWSERMRVPPVTEPATSEPASLSTGADSPVMADSSTDATPTITSPSAGITSPACTSTTSPLCRADESTCSMEPSGSWRRAWVRAWVRRRASAWALPRPSARASA